MARRFLSFASILKRGRVSDFLRPMPLASSHTDAGALLSCSKRSILSGLRVEVPGIRFGAFPQGASFPGQIVDTFLVWAELFSASRDYISRPTHDRLVALRQTSRIPREGKKRRRSEEHTSELQHTVISYAVFCLKKKKK